MRIRPYLVALAVLLPFSAHAQTPVSPENWPQLINPFPSTSGDGTMIDGYAPVVAGGICRTPFIAVLTTGERLTHQIEFDAQPTLGGILCTNGRWKSDDGKNSGTTPFEMFIKDGVVRRKPNS